MNKYDKEDVAGGSDFIIGCLIGSLSALALLFAGIMLFTWIYYLIKG